MLSPHMDSVVGGGQRDEYIQTTLRKQNNQQNSRQTEPDSDAHKSDLDGPSSGGFPRWFVVHPAEASNREQFFKLSPFVIDKSLQCQVGTLKTVKRLQRSDPHACDVHTRTVTRTLNHTQTRTRLITHRPSA